MITGIDLLIRRSYPTSPEWIWRMWTTPDGICAWWAPDGFTTAVDRLDLRVGGSLDYTVTAIGAEQVAFMLQSGLPLATRSHKELTELDEPSRLSYNSLIDFVPGVAPYQHRTVVTLERTVAGRVNELDNLHRLVTADCREERLRV